MPTTTVSPTASLAPVITRHGAQFNAPPTDIIPSITASITKAMESLRADEDGAIVGIADGKGGINAALVLRAPHGFEVMAWIGKSYHTGEGVDYGAAIRKSIKFGP